MELLARRFVGPLAVIVLACALLAGCDGGSAQSGSSASDEASSAASAASGEDPLDPAVRAEIEQAIAEARNSEYKNVTFGIETLTSAIGSEKGKTEKQAVQTTMDGQLAIDGKDKSMHFDYEMQSTAQPTKVAYEMFIDKDGIIVKQDGVFYGGVQGAEPDDYLSSVTGVASEEEVGKLLDAASSYKIEHGDDTTITITADASKLAETGLIDTGSLPANSSIATLVANYVITPDKHFKAVRMMSSTSGTPTYRVNQTYNFSKYDETEMPEWPSAADRVAQDPRIKTDPDGSQYIIAEDGNKYYIDHIDEDGTVHLRADQAAQGGGGGGEVYYYGDGGGDGGGGGGGTSGGGGGGGGGGGTASPDTGGGETGMAEPQISGDDGGTGMGEPQLLDE